MVGKKKAKKIRQDSDEDLSVAELKITPSRPTTPEHVMPTDTSHSGETIQGLLTPISSSKSHQAEEVEALPDEGSVDVPCVDGHKKVFVCCIICSRMVLITAQPTTSLEFIEDMDTSDLCALIFSTCRLDSKSEQESNRWKTSKNASHTLICKQIVQGSRLHRICETIADGTVEILEENDLIMYQTMNTINQSMTSECMIRSVDTALDPSGERSSLLLPFVFGKFM
ncbi:MAG: hypothetical protein GOMPHAMPRED_007114 [Gomphillus americanus]|uniref:Uncharacterized protein n=1 Tax=Gomphillus americanus TaxID=1940652 RepID=A0A8H3G1D4_9LECA|nr:MAG: hypothetical protein GOMPHAMPRED_007114 [Gomphillus americanus]